MKIAHSYNFASGSADDLHCIGYRFDEALGFRPDAGESWVVHITPTAMRTIYGPVEWLTGLWRTAGNRLFVSDAGGVIHYLADASNPVGWRQIKAPGFVRGVWGRDEDFILAWGVEYGEKPFVLRWNGADFVSMPAPSKAIQAIHGRGDVIAAVGDEGLFALWNGNGWTELQSPTTITLTSVFVASEDEIYAVGRGKELLSGSVHGMARLLTADEHLRSVAKWKDRVWIAAGGKLGLCELQGNQLTPIKPNILGLEIDARQDLVISTMSMIAYSKDGAAFKAWLLGGFQTTIADRDPAWV